MENNDGKIDVVVDGKRMRLTIAEVAELEKQRRESGTRKEDAPNETLQEKELRLSRLWAEGKLGSRRGD